MKNEEIVEIEIEEEKKEGNLEKDNNDDKNNNADDNNKRDEKAEVLCKFF
jgi:hypothetical protein